METSRVAQVMAEVADTYILPRFRSLRDDEVSFKNPGDLVTVADREAEVALTAFLEAENPGCVVVGEEACTSHPELMQAVAREPHVFTVDPVDGTKNFVEGRTDFGVMICELRDASPVRSWIYQPLHQTTVTCERGAGVWSNGQRLALSETSDTLTGAISVPPAAGTYDGAVLQHSNWACAIDYPTLLNGEVDFLIYQSSKPWDHAPGWAMLAELGGVLVHSDGSAYTGAVRDAWLGAFASPRIAGRVAPLFADVSSRHVHGSY